MHRTAASPSRYASSRARRGARLPASIMARCEFALRRHPFRERRTGNWCVLWRKSSNCRKMRSRLSRERLRKTKRFGSGARTRPRWSNCFFQNRKSTRVELKSISRYRILEKLGAGGMGEVYLDEDTKLGRKVALKLLSEELTQNRDRLSRFDQEAYAASALNHPNILTIYEMGDEGGRHYIVAEFVDGVTLRKRLRASPMELAEVLDIAIQIADALEEAHAAGIIHRDIKPENVMIRRSGHVKVLDFGLAKLTERQFSAEEADGEAVTRALVQTDAGVVMGTSQYMSPEQARGKPVDVRTDIWSLGVVLYEMAAGRAPFFGDTKTDVIVAIARSEPPPIARFAPNLPAEFEWIVMKALRKNVDERYQTIKELESDLKKLKQRLEV